jgi:hypothetical protein
MLRRDVVSKHPYSQINIFSNHIFVFQFSPDDNQQANTYPSITPHIKHGALIYKNTLFADNTCT